MRLMSESVINEQVARGLEKMYPVTMFKMQSLLAACFGFTFWRHLYRGLQNNEASYRIYCFANE